MSVGLKRNNVLYLTSDKDRVAETPITTMLVQDYSLIPGACDPLTRCGVL